MAAIRLLISLRMNTRVGKAESAAMCAHGCLSRSGTEGKAHADIGFQMVRRSNCGDPHVMSHLRALGEPSPVSRAFSFDFGQ
jgi:hypothetical protein